MSFRVILTNLLVLGLGAFLLIACSDPEIPNPAFGSINTALSSPIATLPEQVPTDLPTETQTATPIPLPSDTPLPTGTTVPTATNTPTATALPYNVTGSVCFPGERVPAMTAFFEETEAGAVVELPISENQDSYEVKLEPGSYIAYAWLPDYSQGGLYSRAVPCGLNENCTDHAVQPFSVQEGQLLQRIDLCDWYAGPFNVPYPPGVDKDDFTGDLSGRLSYRDSSPEQLRVVAYSIDTGYWYWVNAEPGQSFYGINNLPPGAYHVVAYDTQGRAGGYAADDHQLISVLVKAGEITEGADINDWNAPPDAFPPDPTR